MRLHPGDLVGGKYRVTRFIGDGGMGAVYEARHEVLGSMVALKFLHGDLARKPGLAARFLQEAKVSASIQSPHVTRVTDVETSSDGSPYMVMELLNGESLQQLLDRRGKLPRDQAVDFALQVLSGLEAAHALGVVHRDLKPDNVYVTSSSGGPVLKLLDFGIAKLRESSEYQKGLTRPGALMGTPEYMAPEQLYAADRVDHRADVYSLGAILYEMLTGARPAYGDDANQIVGQVAAGKIKRLEEHDPSLPRGLADVVHRALAPDKNQRFGSAFEMRSALAPFAGALSHAGRLAATAAATASVPVQQVRPAPTEDAPVLPHPSSAAAGNWSPVQPVLSPGPGQKGTTQEAPRELAHQIAFAHADARPPHAPVTPAGMASSSYATPYHSAANSAYGYGARRRSGRMLGALVALGLGIVLTGVLVLVLALKRQRTSEESAVETAATATVAPATTITAQAEPTPTATPTVVQAPPATPPVEAKPRPRPRPSANPNDAGSAGSDGGIVIPQFPQISLPSAFPPLPSSLPPLPSGFPHIPGLPFPTEQPAPAPTQ